MICVWLKIWLLRYACSAGKVALGIKFEFERDGGFVISDLGKSPPDAVVARLLATVERAAAFKGTLGALAISWPC